MMACASISWAPSTKAQISAMASSRSSRSAPSAVISSLPASALAPSVEHAFAAYPSKLLDRRA